MRTYAFIDAANLFYGGEKSLGWKIDYNKLFRYLHSKYAISKVLYFGALETHDYPYDYLKHKTLPLRPFEQYLQILLERSDLPPEIRLRIERRVRQIHFYEKLGFFGYCLYLKPVKRYVQQDGSVERKGNCDVEMAFHLMKHKNKFGRVLILSGDGDFLPVLKHLREVGKEVIILARRQRTAREIRQFAGSNFRDFDYLRKPIEKNKRTGPTKDTVHD